MSKVLENFLTEISVESLPDLKEKFKCREHILAYSLIQNVISRQVKSSEQFITFYSLNDAWKKDGLFVAVMVRKVQIAIIETITRFEISSVERI